MHGDRFDEFVSNEILERGQRHCGTEPLGLLYAYRYSAMHYAALAQLMPSEAIDTLIDFGGGPGTAMLALAGLQDSKFDRLALEHAEGMRRVARVAHQHVGAYCAMNKEHAFPDAKFWYDAHRVASGRNVLIVFSYFFAQRLTAPFVRALARRISSLPSSKVTIVYTNSIGPSASWMPRGGMHDWYEDFSRRIGHSPRIKEASYSYRIQRNLTQSTTRSGACAFEVWQAR